MSGLASHTIRARALQSILAYGEQEGVDGPQLRARLHLEDGDGGDPDRPLPLALTDAAWVWATRLGTPLNARNLRRRVLDPATAAVGLDWVG